MHNIPLLCTLKVFLVKDIISHKISLPSISPEAKTWTFVIYIIHVTIDEWAYGKRCSVSVLNGHE